MKRLKGNELYSMPYVPERKAKCCRLNHSNPYRRFADTADIIPEYRFAAGKLQRFAALAAELVHLQVNLLVTDATPAAQAAKDATSTIPIVMAPVPRRLRLGSSPASRRRAGTSRG